LGSPCRRNLVGVEVFDYRVQQCPYCEAAWFTRGEPDTIAGEFQLVIFRDCRCIACGREWRDQMAALEAKVYVRPVATPVV
jgi:Zn-finger nucleic acid-binding protein